MNNILIKNIELHKELFDRLRSNQKFKFRHNN